MCTVPPFYRRPMRRRHMMLLSLLGACWAGREVGALNVGLPPQSGAVDAPSPPTDTSPTAPLAEPARPSPVKPEVLAALRHVGEISVQALGDGNIVLSPTSVLAVLAGLAGGAAAGARGSLPEWFRAALALPAEALREQLLPAADAMLRTAAAFWRAPDLTLRPEFVAHVEAMLGGSPRAIAPEAMVEAVNAWVKAETEGLIERLLEAKGSDLRFVAASAVAFKGAWATAFDPAATRLGHFLSASGRESDVPLMSTEVPTLALGGRDLRGVVLPYRGDRYGFVALRKAARGREAPSLGQLFEAISGLPFGDGAELRWAPRLTKVRLPKFEVEAGGNVAEALGRGGYRGLVGARLEAAAEEELVVREVVHRARIRVDEEGTAAAAATAAVGVRTAVLQAEEVVFDQPFVFAVVDLPRRLPVFVGVFRAPPR